MIEIQIPGHKKLHLKHLVLDYNGTIAFDGRLIPGVKEKLEGLSEKLQIHIITADTFGLVQSEMGGIPCKITVLPVENQDAGKLEYIKSLMLENTVCIGNGRNDRMMLKEASLGIAVVQEEGAAIVTILEADILCSNILTALDLLINPLRLVATLRS